MCGNFGTTSKQDQAICPCNQVVGRIADDRVVNSGIILEVDLLGVSEFLILM
jgi:hypothetical protein